MKTLAQIKTIATKLALKIEVPTQLLPTFGMPIGDATPNIEVDHLGLYHYVISERGTEFNRQTTTNLNQLLYWMFSSVTFSMACNYELKNRIENKDPRRLIFKKQEELLAILDKHWEEEAHNKHILILKNNPFDDLAGLRTAYFKDLRAKGILEAQINKLAYKKYPKPINP